VSEPQDRATLGGDARFAQIIGTSAALERVLCEVERVAPTDASVLVLGETGTGKELVARAIHQLSARCGRAFVKLNCAAIPMDLLESELFGHEKGAFTGAIAQKVGRFERADRGTLFLDEVGDIPLALQPKLLLQEQEFERLGGTQTLRADVRVLAATNCDLEEMVAGGRFRADLYYRLNVFPVVLPPLRERREDIPALVTHFVEVSSRKLGKPIERLAEGAMAALVAYDWPGNVRELQNVIERAVILADGGVLPDPLAAARRLPASSPLAAASPTTPAATHPPTLRDSEREAILNALEAVGWVVGGPGGAAARLGLNRTTLINMMKRLGIERPARPRLDGPDKPVPRYEG
jgi:transcriptional regulator with GAF, ATPase, and Fis domain